MFLRWSYSRQQLKVEWLLVFSLATYWLFYSGKNLAAISCILAIFWLFFMILPPFLFLRIQDTISLALYHLVLPPKYDALHIPM